MKQTKRIKKMSQKEEECPPAYKPDTGGIVAKGLTEKKEEPTHSCWFCRLFN